MPNIRNTEEQGPAGKDTDGVDDTIPLQYLSNENPFAFCHDYHRNTINLPEKKARLAALQRIQPARVSFRMSQKQLEIERTALIDAAVSARSMQLIKHGLHLLGITYHDSPEEVFALNIENPDILEIAVELKKLKHIKQQRRLRTKVSTVIAAKIADTDAIAARARDILIEDNVRDALVYSKIEDLYSEQ